jgi:hypothetical protein
MELLINMGCFLFGAVLTLVAVWQGFKMGRHTQDKPVVSVAKQKDGQPVLEEYSPWEDAMGDNDVRETVGK